MSNCIFSQHVIYFFGINIDENFSAFINAQAIKQGILISQSSFLIQPIVDVFFIFY